MQILASMALLLGNKKFQLQNVLNPWTSDSKSNTLHQNWTNLAFACKTGTLGSLYSHALLIQTKSSKSKFDVHVQISKVHEQIFKDLLSSTCQISSERRVLNLESEVQGFNTHWWLHFVTGFFFVFM